VSSGHDGGSRPVLILSLLHSGRANNAVAWPMKKFLSA